MTFLYYPGVHVYPVYKSFQVAQDATVYSLLFISLQYIIMQ